MAKRKDQPSDTTAAAAAPDETVSSYFRRLFEENPQWLDSRSNADLFDRWLQDHPGETTVPERIRQILSNLKSVLRKKSRKRRRRAKTASEPAAATNTAAPRKSVRGLDSLEEQIDDCLTAARSVDREGLAEVISLAGTE